MPISDLAEAKDLDAAVQTLLDAPAAAREQRLRAIFVEKLDFAAASGAVRLPGAKIKIAGEEQAAPAPARIAQSGGVQVVWTRIDDAKITAVTTRAILKALGRELDGEHLLVLSNADDALWHVIWPADEGGRTVLRRMVIERDLPRRTVVTQLAKIYEPKPTGAALHSRIDTAFDVAPVTKEFFKTYAAVFHRVSDMIEGIGDPEQQRLFCQTLFNRLMFVYFLQRKGWLSLNRDRNYLRALRADSKRTKDGNFYRDRLLILFFSALNNPDSRNLSRGVRAAVGDVPFLNGGLFEKGHIDEECAGATVPDEAFDLILGELFDRFNFTVSESTPYDIEVAVDPEMLGRVFEELVTDRHETGSYYTPRQVVAFMCREALKGYLETRVDGLGADAARRFIDEHDVSALNLTQARKVSDALDDVTVVDPACGSGAYLVGMLHELIELQTLLYSEKLQRNADRLYDMKLHIIERNVYGADVDEFATNIAMLRLWLTLAIEYDGEDPPPLPNLDFKIANGDSLTAPNPSIVGDMFRQAIHETAAKLAKLKGDYLNASGTEKAGLRREIEAAERELARATAGSPAPERATDWRVTFAEVFDRGGFDIVLANPPYVRADAQFKHLKFDESARQAAIDGWKQYREQLVASKNYSTLYEKWDLFIPFIERAYQLLRNDGEMVYIISDAYNAAKYATRSHEFFVRCSALRRIDFCTDIPIFDAGVRNTIIHFAKSAASADHAPVRVRRWGQSAADFDLNQSMLKELVHSQDNAASLFRQDDGETIASSVDSVPLGSLCYVSKGMVINADESDHHGAFSAEDLLSDTPNPTHPVRFVLGKDLDRWQPRRTRYLEWGTERAPAWFSRATFPELQEAGEKILAVRTPGIQPKALYDERALCFDASSVGLVRWCDLRGVVNRSISKAVRHECETVRSAPRREDLEQASEKFSLKYLLSIMNSSFAKRWLAGKRKSRFHVYPDDWKKLPIAVTSREVQAQLAEKVDQIIDLVRRSGSPLPEAAEKQLDRIEQEVDDAVTMLYRGAPRGRAGVGDG